MMQMKESGHAADEESSKIKLCYTSIPHTLKSILGTSKQQPGSCGPGSFSCNLEALMLYTLHNTIKESRVDILDAPTTANNTPSTGSYQSF